MQWRKTKNQRKKKWFQNNKYLNQWRKVLNRCIKILINKPSKLHNSNLLNNRQHLLKIQNKKWWKIWRRCGNNLINKPISILKLNQLQKKAIIYQKRAKLRMSIHQLNSLKRMPNKLIRLISKPQLPCLWPNLNYKTLSKKQTEKSKNYH